MPRRILVIDKTQSLLDLFQEILREEGYDVLLSLLTFPDLDRIDQLQPDLIILDHMFGWQAEGWQMLEHLKARPSTRHIPVIVCTAAPMTADHIEPYLTTHHVELLPKPFSVDDLLGLVTQGLEAERVAGKVLIAQVVPGTSPSKSDGGEAT